MTVAVDVTVWRARGAPLVPATGSGALSGHTVAVKDLYAVAGFAVGAGVRSYPEHREPETRHAAVVATLLGAGAEITGIAQTDEFAYSISGGNGRFGMPVNPAAPERVPGGSSSGPPVPVGRGGGALGLGDRTRGGDRGARAD
ncbi:amidase family protein [Nocardia wallacei]|uniref:amidase family protein n=1 Tax=Nocardia wallacei TaxID=480035 RepID=UPI002455B46C|nr:amidase family protein [Nocardia wallacei]